MPQIKQLQSHLIISGSLSDPYAAGKLIVLLTTSHHADLWHAQHLFDLLPHRSTYVWNTMIRSFAERNVPIKAISLYKRMVDSGVSPNNYTFSFVLRACAELSDVLLGFICHAQVVRLGWEGRAGMLEQAKKVVMEMPMEPDSYVLGALLNACRVHGNVNLGEEMVKSLVKRRLDHSGVHVLLSNIYASADKWDGVEKVRNGMEQKKVNKVPGCSLIEVDGCGL
ncbi:hypothetical protein RJ639_042565 [Escallonia herrerae]|uniref:Pentatricopeptide repeat-containing protein n=1 Tax=Escallonia herrerae TaxID=1293975 RepID=A0AA88WFG2_9ASTE|nr:hypothetical protein RJ639_042565 [Escallonia herrerae]